MRTVVLALVAVLGGCGLVDPAGPPARLLGAPPEVPGAAIPERPSAIELAPPFPGYALAWHDEFDGTALDDASWTINEGRHRDAVNSRQSVVVRDGLLSLVTFTADGVHHAPHVTTKDKVEPRYGYFEARVRFLDSVGQWCSFFLYPETIGNPRGDPGRAGVEIDFFEHRDGDDGYDLRNLVQVGINWDGFDEHWKRDHLEVAHPHGEPLTYAWHTYAGLWTESGQTFYIDDVPVWSTAKAVSHIPMPIYLACEVLNDNWVGIIPASGYGSLERSTTRMEVDWVRVWQPATAGAR